MAEGGTGRDSPPSLSTPKNDNADVEGSQDSQKTVSSNKNPIMGKLEKLFDMLNVGSQKGGDETEAKKKLTIEMIAEQIKNGERKRIIIMCGAGISTSAGIPDFRSPGSGLYDNLQKYDLPDPQCIFEISYFKRNPQPFYSLAKELLPGLLKPTPCHYFLRLLHQNGHLLRLYTQNIDTLERIAGIPGDKIVEAHGTFHTSHCLNPACQKKFSLEWMRAKINSDELPKCPDCDGIIKPDVVFFGEALPTRFFKLSQEDFKTCDLLIVMGTSLVVQPFASLVHLVPKGTPRLLINKEKAGEAHPVLRALGFRSGMDFDSQQHGRDVAWLGTCDDGCLLLAELLGWKKELREMIREEHRKIEDLHKKQSADESVQNDSHY